MTGTPAAGNRRRPTASPTPTTIAGRVAAARERDHLLTLTVYCESSACPVRIVTIDMKDFDRTAAPTLARGGLHCPVCGASAVSLHAVRTSRQVEAERDLVARWSVNRQMRRRDGGDDPLVVSLAALADDRLPPTPPDWFRDRPAIAASSPPGTPTAGSEVQP